MSSNIVPTEAVHSFVLHASLAIDPPRVIRSKGHYHHTSDGRAIFDASGGAAVSCIGHGNERVKQAITAQLDATEYCFAPHFTSPAYEQVAKFLVDSTGGKLEKVFVTGSGSEAVEACIKMARQYHVERGEPQRTRFIARERSYHGNTLGSLAVSGHRARRSIYEPLLGEQTSFVSQCHPYRDLKDGESGEAYVNRLAKELDNEFQRVGPDTVCAVFLETMAGVTLGAVAPLPGYLKAMQAVCERYGALFVLDEVLSGMGRTGTLHAWEQEGVIPDLQTVAKGLGGGYAPVAALLIGKKVVNVLSQGTKAFIHFHTYHGHPLACAAAYEVQQIIEEEGLLDNCKHMGVYLGERLRQRLGHHTNVGDIRGRGLAWAIELVKDKTTKKPFPVAQKVAPTIHAVGLQKFEIAVLPGGGVVDGIDGDIIVLAPAYNVTKKDVDLIVDRTAKAIEAILGPAALLSQL